MLYGIDHASHQGYINMALLREQGHTFAIGKCTGENDYVNPYYAENHRRAIAAGILTGSYDWTEPQDPRQPEWLAADYLRCVDALGGRPLGHLLTSDFETPDWHKGPRGRNIEPFMRRFLYTLKDLAKQPIGVYTAPYFLQETGAINWPWLRDFWYWMAAPGSGMVGGNAPWQQPLGPPWQQVAIHQHQWYAQSKAIGSGANFDRNRFNGSLAELQALGAGGDDWQYIPVTKKEGDVQEPPPGKWTTYINKAGNPIFAWNPGGETDTILGSNVQDLGMSVMGKSQKAPLDVSIKNNEQLPWRERR